MKCICCDTESHIIHSGWHLSMNDEDHIIHATHPSWNHAFTKMNRSGNLIFFLFFVFCSHTFVVWVNSLRTADLTRNVKVGEGTGQVNINPDKSTMLGWNFDRIITYNRHKTPQYTVYTQESKAQTDRLEQTRIFRDTLHIKSLVADKK